MTFKEILEFHFIHLGHYQINLIDVLEILLVFTIARILSWIFNRIVLLPLYRKKTIDSGRRYAFHQFFRYIIYTFAILVSLQSIGVNLSLLWAGSAALLVGIGLGLQQTFNDLISGIILLLEGTVEVDDILEVNGTVGRVQQIGLRTSKLITRDSIDLIIPNSQLITEQVVNWSHNATPTRFKISVGVSYASDVDLVTEILLASVKEHADVLDDPPPQVQFIEFGSSSLDFTLFFYSYQFWRIEVIRSEIRYAIIRKFRAQEVEIPFPQQDIWFRNAVPGQEIKK